MMALGQEMSVKSFEYLPKDLTARTSPRNDRNGIPCAVIRVGIALQGVVFDGNTIGKPVYNTGEYLVYMPEGSKQVTIRHDSYLPLTVVFADYGIDKVESSSTYRLTVPTGAAPPPQRKGNFLTMNVTPTSSQVSIDDGVSTATDSDGSFKVFLNNGTHSYRVEAGNAYSPVSGTVEMKGERITLPITLQSVKASLSIKAITSGSKIYVNEDYKGIDQWQGELPPGTYLVEAKKDGYRPYSTTVSLAKQQSETLTIPALQASYGTLMVDYKPIDAEVYLDNTLLGKAPNVFDNILAGKHNIKISKAGYADYTGSVNIQENQQASISGSLSKIDLQKNTNSRKVKVNTCDSKDILIGTIICLYRNGLRVDGVVSDLDGDAYLSVQNGDVIKASYVDYISQQIKINDINALNDKLRIELKKGNSKKTEYKIIGD